MKILVLGGTRYFGKHAVKYLIKNGHDVTIATRGLTKDNFGDSIDRVIADRYDSDSLKSIFDKNRFDVVLDSLAYASNDVKLLLDVVNCHKYVMTSSAAVYDRHMDIKESSFDPLKKQLVWCGRADFAYDEVKRQAECALFQKYSHIKSAAVRFPYVLGRDDYTKRLLFYVEHIINGKPMCINDLNEQIAFINSDEAGKFLSFICESEFCGVINGSGSQTISIAEIMDYIEKAVNKKAVFLDDGEPAPFNDEISHSINT